MCDVHMYMSVCMCGYVCVQVHIHNMCMCLWRPADGTGRRPHYFSLCSLEQVTSGGNQRALKCSGGFLASGEQRLGS